MAIKNDTGSVWSFNTVRWARARSLTNSHKQTFIRLESPRALETIFEITACINWNEIEEENEMSNSIHSNHVSASICEESVSIYIPKSIFISCCVCVDSEKENLHSPAILDIRPDDLGICLVSLKKFY